MLALDINIVILIAQISIALILPSLILYSLWSERYRSTRTPK